MIGRLSLSKMVVGVELRTYIYRDKYVCVYVSVCVYLYYILGKNLLTMDAFDRLASAPACACRGGIKMRTNGIIERSDI